MTSTRMHDAHFTEQVEGERGVGDGWTETCNDLLPLLEVRDRPGVHRRRSAVTQTAQTCLGE